MFVEAPSRDSARRRICELVALIAHRTLDDVRDCLYNLYSGYELVEAGMSECEELRLLECSWSGERIGYIDAPLFLVRDPQPLLQAWIRARSADR